MTSTHSKAVRIEPPTEYQDLLSWLDMMRAGTPACHDETGTVHLFGYDDVVEVLSDHGTYSSDFSALVPQQADFALFAKGNFAGIDPPRHNKLRGLVSQVFTPRYIAGLEPAITMMVDDLLDRLRDVDEPDMVEYFAHPLPGLVISKILGIPAGDADALIKAADAMVTSDEVSVVPDEERQNSLAHVLRELTDYMLGHIANRRADPADDLVSRLIATDLDGERLDDEEIVGFIGLLLLAGHKTSTFLLGNTILTLDEHPDAAAELRSDPTITPTAVEEFMRFRGPTVRLGRLTTRETTVGGLTVAARQPVMVWPASANRDERQFAEATRLDLHRKPNRHLSLGHGVHFCLGAPLARLEMTVSLREMNNRMASMTVSRDRIELFDPRGVFGARRIPVAITWA